MAKIITLTLGQFLLLGETQAKILAMQGYQINIVNDVHNSVENGKPTSFSKTETKPAVATAKSSSKPAKADKSASKKSATKGSSDKPTQSTKGGKKLAFGKVKVGDYFKVVVDKQGKLITTRIGKADKIDSKDNILTAVGGKKFALERCIAISKETYGKLKKSLKDSEAKPVSTSTKLTAKDYKVVYCFNLTKLGKITEEDFAKAKNDDQVATELYKKFKDEVKLANSEAIKLLAENSAKAQPQA